MRLIALACGWLLGLYLGSRFGLPVGVSSAATVAALGSALLLRRRWRLLVASLFIAGASSGVLRFHFQDSGQADGLASYRGMEVALQGRVVGTPESRGSAFQFRVQVDRIQADGGWRSASGLVAVSARPTRDLAARQPPYVRPGDVLWLKGRLEAPRPFADFDFPAYLASQGVRSAMVFPALALQGSGQAPWWERTLFSVRTRLGEALGKALPAPQAGLAKALALGLRSDLPPDVSADFNRSGTAHILAVSGLHVALVLAFAMALARRIPRGPRFLVYVLPLAAVWLYAALAGLSPSAQRAAVMATFYLAATAMGRQRHGLEALLLAAFAITVFNPLALWQVSFQLSFLAMAGIVLVGLPLLDYLSPLEGPPREGVLRIVVRWALEVFAMGLAATLFTWPAVAFYFHRVSLVGIPATALILPALPFAVGLSFLTALVGLASPAASWAFGWAAWVALGYTTWVVVHLFAALPLASLRAGGVGPALAWTYYAVLGVCLWAMHSLRGVQQQLRSLALRPALVAPAGPALPKGVLLAAGLVLFTGGVWWSALAGSPTRLEVTVLDLGRGQGVLLRAPSGQTALIDGGEDPRALRSALGRALPFRTRRIDLLVATHPGLDHIGGLIEGLKGYTVRATLQPPVSEETATWQSWQEELHRKGGRTITAVAGQSITLGEMRAEVVHPPVIPLASSESDADNNTVVLRIGYGGVSFLLAGGIRALAEGYLVANRAPLGGTVLVVGRPGSRPPPTDDFLKAVRPEVAVISAPEVVNRPYAATLKELEQRLGERHVFVTARDGWVRLSTDGRRLWVKTGR